MSDGSRRAERTAGLGLRGWLRVRPGPASLDDGPRVEVTPPTEQRATPFALMATIVDDIRAVLEHDPAARHALEVVLVYPGLHALWMHRVSHAFWTRGCITGPRVFAHVNRMITGIEIHPGARIGRGVFIDHGMGIVIGETAVVGDECLLYKGVVLGGTSLERKERHPRLGRGVVVGTNACVLGPIHIGDGAKVGSNSVVIRDVPPDATVIGVPGKVVTNRRQYEQLDHANLPDPVASVISELIGEVDRLRARLDALEGGAA